MDAPPLMPYEWELPRMRNEREHLNNQRRVLTEHDRVSNKCLVKSASAQICIEMASNELAMARALPVPYLEQKKRLDKTCSSRLLNPLVLRKANYFKTSQGINN